MTDRVVRPVGERRGRDLLLEVLATEGVRHVFGNPGTTELPFLDALAASSEIEYLLALHESVAIAMADGYAQITRRPAFVNLHTAPGLGNAIGMLANAQATRTPMVITAGQQDRRHLLSEPFLSGDLVGLASPVSKWAVEVHAVRDLGTTMRRAFNDAASAPSGPVFVGLPMDLLDEPIEEGVPPLTSIDRRTIPAAIGTFASSIAAVPLGRLAIVAGDEVARSQGLDALIALAERTGARVFGTPLHSNLVFPSAHPLWGGALPVEASAIRDVMGDFDAALLIGGRGFMTFPYDAGPVLPDGFELLHLSPDPMDLGRMYPAQLALVGDPKATLEALVSLLDPATRAVHDYVEKTRGEMTAREIADDERLGDAYADAPLGTEVAVHALLRALPPETIVVEESPTADRFVRSLLRSQHPDRFFYSRGGGLGWGMAAALGISLGDGGSPVACVVGDGSMLYAPQALWSAARLRLPVVFFVFNNGRYQILERFLRARGDEAARSGRYVGTDLSDPAVDFVGLARSFGVEAQPVSSASELSEVVRAAVGQAGPLLVEVPVLSD